MQVTNRAKLLAAACMTVVAGSADVPAGVQNGTRQLSVEFTEEFHVGDDPSEHQFARVSEMAFAPDGALVVLDADDYTITVYDTGGNRIARWGGEGDGPGEWPFNPVSMAMSPNGVVATEVAGRIDLFSTDGTVLGSRLVRPLSVRGIAFVTDSTFVVAANRGRRSMDRSTELVRLTDAETLWSSPPIPSLLGNGPMSMWEPKAVFGPLWDGRVAIGMSDAYDLQVFDVSTGRTVGRITRDVPMRGPTDEFMETLREETREIFGEDSPVYQRLAPSDPFPIITKVMTGPPGRTIWIGRGTGIDDAFASPVGESMDDWEFHHYDLFDGGSYEYLGTIDIPEELRLMAGDAERIAGFQRGPFGIHSVRVLRVELN